ncbi:hypothetical protein GKIL_4474 [Gloeobacter kilaueensis JS1]|uniref:Uncharacterized protein n=2 Tax=Gloeobacter TaxID=33071 RepID=U5QSL0_GLOK1|nr:hypothetical protein GKIL_4474 [Gloeobacter kilaueensis JS1]
MANFRQQSEMPEELRISIEKLMLETTEPLDPLLSLKITNMTMNLAKVVYQMGRRDGSPSFAADGFVPF